MQVLASIQIKRLALVQMNQTLDYSYENTPVSSQAANGSQVQGHAGMRAEVQGSAIG